MKFTEHRDTNVLTVKKYQPGQVKINDFDIEQSCFLNQKHLEDDWACHRFEDLSEAVFQPLIDTYPEVIILGTGETQKFPQPSLFAFCAQKGIGLEAMDNAAACRTYNVLTTEERDVVLALILG